MNEVSWRLLAACAALLVHSQARGAATHFTSRAQFEAAAGVVERFDFETASGFPAAPALISSFDDGRISSLSTLGNMDVLVPATLQVYPPGSPNQVLTGARASPGLSTESLHFQLNSPVYGVAFDVYVAFADENEEVYVSVNGNSGVPRAPYVLRDRDGDASSPVFFGVLSDEPIRTVDVSAINPLVGAPFPVYMPHGVDNFTVTAVPEPGGLAALAVGCFAWLRVARGRKRFEAMCSRHSMRDLCYRR